MTPEDDRALATALADATVRLRALQEHVGSAHAPNAALQAFALAAETVGRLRSRAAEPEDESADDDLDLAHIELEALAARITSAAQERRQHAEGLEPGERAAPPDVDRAAYAHGVAAGLTLAGRWLARTTDRLPHPDADAPEE